MEGVRTSFWFSMTLRNSEKSIEPLMFSSTCRHASHISPNVTKSACVGSIV
jgi:hypothetical protein